MLKIGYQKHLTAALAATLAIVLAPNLLAQSGSRGMGMGGGPGRGGSGQLPGPQEKRRYTPPTFAPRGPSVPVAEVRLKGDHSVSESRIRAKLRTRTGRPFDPNTVTADVRHLTTSGLCYDVRTFTEETPQGVIVTFELFEQPTIQYVEFDGAKVRDKTLLKQADLAVGQPLNTYRVEEAQRSLEEFYRARGNAFVKIEVIEGTARGDKGIRFQIQEGPRQRVRWTKFEGNTIASDARLRTLIDSKPGILWFIKGQVDHDVIDEDIQKLTAYYRSLGYFRAVIQKKLVFDKDQEWLNLTFQINEGPRYVVQEVIVQGNQVFDTGSLMVNSELRSGDYFNQAKMNSDVRNLRNMYGSQGYINVSVVAEPQFFEEPGQLAMVYKIEEGKQYRVGDIKINIDGEHPHTRHAVILNRIDMRTGDIIDINKLRNSELRLQRSQLFETGPFGGPEIAVRPKENGTEFAGRSTSTLR